MFVPNINKIGKILHVQCFWVHYFLNASRINWKLQKLCILFGINIIPKISVNTSQRYLPNTIDPLVLLFVWFPPHSSKLQQFLIYQGVKICNSIPPNIINQSLYIFKHSFKQFLLFEKIFGCTKFENCWKYSCSRSFSTNTHREKIYSLSFILTYYPDECPVEKLLEYDAII